MILLRQMKTQGHITQKQPLTPVEQRVQKVEKTIATGKKGNHIYVAHI